MLYGGGVAEGGKHICELRIANSTDRQSTAYDLRTANSEPHRNASHRIDTYMTFQYYTLVDVCDMLKISDDTLVRMINTGEIGAIKVGRGWRIASDSIDRYLNRQITDMKMRMANLRFK
jgi:excisionase family DNA binding protein